MTRPSAATCHLCYKSGKGLRRGADTVVMAMFNRRIAEHRKAIRGDEDDEGPEVVRVFTEFTDRGWWEAVEYHAQTGAVLARGSGTSQAASRDALAAVRTNRVL